MRIALLEDDPAQTELMQSWMNEAGYSASDFSTGKDFQEGLSANTYDLLVVDWNLPDTTGVEMVKWVRQTIDWHIPVLFITSRDQEEDIVTALEAGADDYMTKPPKQAETLARLRALSRRVPSQEDSAPVADLLEYPPYIINMDQRQFTVEGEMVELTRKEFELAVLLFNNIGRLLSRSFLMDKVWGTTVELNTRTVDTHISRVRNKLGIRPERGWRLSAVYHHGYRLEHAEET